VARVVRFLLYAALGTFVIARNAVGIVWEARALSADYLYLPDAGCLVCSLALGLIMGAYLVWLSGATIARWVMPVWVHYPIIGLMALSVLISPSAPDPAKAGPERIRDEAVRAIDSTVARLRTTGCSQTAANDALRGLGRSGFLARGFPMNWVSTQISSEIPFDDSPRTRPATLLLRCSADGSFDLAAVVLDHVPRGKVAVLRDDVGNVFHVSVARNEQAPLR
jgi:hypothetical protein